MNNIAFDVLILATLLLVIYFKNKQLISFLNSNLGRFILIVVVVILSVRNILYGLLALVLFFVLRENYYVEGLDNVSASSEIQGAGLVNVNEVPLDGSITVKSVQESVTTETITKTTSGHIDGTEKDDSSNLNQMNNWRKTNCSKDNLPMFNNKIVPSNLLTNVFQNISFVNDLCNPCESDCKFLVSSSSDSISPSTIIHPVSSNSIPSSQSRGGNAVQTYNFADRDGTKAGSGLNLTPFPIPSQDAPSNLVNKSAPNASKISPAMAPPMQSIASMPK